MSTPLSRAQLDEPGARLGAAQHAALVLAVLLCRVLARNCFPVYDDAFITYRYAQHMAEGLGLVYNPGAAWEPVLGTTTPLYALLLAGCARLGADLVSASFVLNLACDVLTAVLLPRLFGRARIPSTFALCAFAALPQLVRISAGGMEAPLFALCGVGAVLALARGIPVLAGALAALTCIVRPEGLLLVAILLAARVRRPRELLRFAAPVALIGLASFVWLSAAYGSAIPQSVRAKAAMHSADVLDETRTRWATILVQSFAPALALLPLLPFVVYGAARALRAQGALRLLSLWALAITAGYLAARPHTWGWYYYVPLLAWTLWFGVGAARAWSWIEPRLGGASARRAGAFGPQLLALGAIAAAGFAAWKLPSAVDSGVYAPMRAWAARTSSAEPKARILASDIGAIGWWWKGTVLDTEGLVWPEALRYGGPDRILAAEAPEYLMIVAERPWLRLLRARPELLAQYAAVARFSAEGQTDLDPDPEQLSPEWSQDYIVYRRRTR